MTGIIVTTPPTVEPPPGNSGSGPNSLPGVTYQYAVLNIPQTWTAKQTFPQGNISIYASDIIGGTGSIVPVSQGGTGAVTASAGFDALAPTTTRGDLIARGASTNGRLALGTSGYALLSNGTDPAWTGYVPTGTGSTTRTWNAKVADFVSVLDFANVDNTGATDSTAGIQAAITAVQSSGATLYFPAGTYKISSALTITVTNVRIVGSGRLSAIIKTTSTTANIFTITAPYTTIEHLGLIGSAAAVQTAGWAINCNGAYSSLFNDLYISDLFNGIGLSNSSNCFVTYTKMANLYGSFGIQSSSGGGDYIAFNQVDPLFYGGLYLMSAGFGAWAALTPVTAGQVRTANGGFFICSQSGTTASGSGPVISLFNTQITDGTAKWYFLCATNCHLMDVTAANSNYIAFNDFSGPSAAGIIVQSGDGNMLVSNTVGQILGGGIQLQGTNTLVQGNIVSGCYGQFAAAIIDNTATSSTGARIVNNFINGSGWYGIFIQSVNCTIEGNYLTGAGQITSVYGIEVLANLNNFIISNNTIVASAGMTGPIRVNAGTSTNYSISGNQCGSGVIVDSGTGTGKVVLTQTFSTIPGNVGIGTTNPQVPLEVSANATATPAPAFLAGTNFWLIGKDGAFNNSLTLDQYGGQVNNSNDMSFRQARGTAASPTAVQSGDTLGEFRFWGYDGSNFYRTAALFVSPNETFSGTAGGADLAWYTTPNTTRSLGVCATFKASGGVTIGSGADPGAGGLGANTSVIAGTFLKCGSFTVAGLPAGTAGAHVWASNCRVFNGAGTQEGAGSGTGGLVTYNGTAWKIAGTNVTAVA